MSFSDNVFDDLFFNTNDDLMSRKDVEAAIYSLFDPATPTPTSDIFPEILYTDLFDDFYYDVRSDIFGSQKEL